MIADCSPISTHPERCNIPQDAMAVDGRPSIVLACLCTKPMPQDRSQVTPFARSVFGIRRPRFPRHARDASLSRCPHTRGRSPAIASRQRSASCSHPNAPWGRSVSEARRAYPLIPLPVKGPRIRLASLRAWRSARDGEDRSPPPRPEPRELTITRVRRQALTARRGQDAPSPPRRIT